MCGGSSGQRPVARGERITVEIKDLSHDGEGVGHVGGFTVFVPETAPGDLVEAKVISVKPSYARALPEALRRSSPRRAAPPCPRYPRCGGCRLQHLRYDEQLAFKQKKVEETLRRLGGLSVPVRPILGMPEPWRYRNKVQVPVGTENGRLVTGFYEKGTHRIVDTDACLLQHPAGDQALAAARAALQELRIPPYDEKTHRGCVRHLLIRVAFSTGAVLLTIVTNGAKLPRAGKLVELLCRRIDNLTGIVQNINDRPGNTVLGPDDVTLWGKPYLEEKLDGLTFRVSPRSFFQVNPAQTAVLYREVRRATGLTGGETVFDLYCGIGTIALCLAEKAARVVGVELSPAAVADARINAAVNRIKNAAFHAGRAEEVVPALAARGCSADVVVVDPPRKGCHLSLLETIAAVEPKRIVYVSCNPATLARDLAILAGHGYRAEAVQPVDMFPHTAHVEAVVLMEKK